MKHFIIAMLTLGTFFVGVHSASALLLDAGDFVNPKERVDGDVYLAGQTVQIDSPVDGDAIIAGGVVDIDAEISQDAIIAGDQVTISKEIGDDARIAASTVKVKGNIKGDVIVFAQALIIDKDVTISGDIIAFVSQFKLDGIVEGNIRVAAENTMIAGKVMGDSNITTGDFSLEGSLGSKTQFIATQKVDISDNAQFGGNVVYGFVDELNLDNQLVDNATATRDEGLLKDITGEENMNTRLFSGFLVWRLLSASLVILLLFWVAKPFITRAVKKIDTFKDGYQALFRGALLFFVPIFIIILLFISVIGIPLGLFTLFAYISLVVFSQSIASVVTAQWLHHKYQFGTSQWQVFLIALGIYVILYMLSFVPIIGWFIGLIVVYVSLGALLLEYRNKK